MADVINPYIAGNPVTGEEMFFGREDIFNFIRQTLTGKHRDQVIVLYGQRRTGKTSILYQLHRRLDPRYLCIFIDLHGLFMESEGSFLWELARQIRRVLARDYGIELPQPDRAAFEANPRGYFANDFLDQAWQAVGGRHILLMIDEAVRLQEQVLAGKLDKSIFEYLRYLMQHYERLNFLFSIGSGLEQMEKEYAFLFNVALYKKISFLERDAAVALVTEPVQAQYHVEPEAVSRILSVTACHPYYTQLLCHSLFNRWRQTDGPSVGVADVEAVMEEVVERGLAVLKHTWEESTPGEKAVMAGLAAVMGDRNQPVDEDAVCDTWQRLGVMLPDDEMAKAMRSLAARDIITGDDQVRFTVDLQHFWIRKFQRLEWVREEIRDQIDAWSRMEVAPRPASQPLPTGATDASPPNRSRQVLLVIGGVILVLLAALFLMQILDWNPFAAATPEPPPAQSSGGGAITLGGEAAQVNDMVLAGGYVWAATEGGLIRWSADGSWERFFGEDVGFPDDWNQTITVAPDGTFWIGGGGVSHVQPTDSGLSFIDYYNRDDDLGMNRVRALLADSDGAVWAGGSANLESPLSRFYEETGWDHGVLSLEEPKSWEVELEIWSLMRSWDGSLWIGLERDGILRWDGDEWSHWGPDEGLDGRNLEDARVRALAEDNDGNIWAAGSQMGLLRYSLEDDVWEAIAEEGESAYVTHVAIFDDALWVGAEEGWIVHSHDSGQTWDIIATPDDGLGEDITAIVGSEDGVVFVSSYGGGVSAYANGEWTRLQQ